MRPPLTLCRQLTRPSPGLRGFVTSARRYRSREAAMAHLMSLTSQLQRVKAEMNAQSAKSARLAGKFDPSFDLTAIDDFLPHWLDQLDPEAKEPPTSDIDIECVEPASAVATKNNLALSSPDIERMKLSYVYLRDLCKCSKCVDPHSKQRSFRTSDIPKRIAPRNVKWDGEYLQIEWDEGAKEGDDKHVSRWHYSYLDSPSIDTHDAFQKSTIAFPWSSDRMQKYQHWIPYEDFMTGGDDFIAAMRNLQRSGLIFVKDIPHSRESVEKIATKMGPLRNTFYGSTFDVRTVPQAKNVAYTNTFLGFHMDLMYMNEPPGYQLLHCLENSCEGGESLFADAFRAASIMKNRYPTQYALLAKFHLAYEYVHEDNIYYNIRPVFEIDRETKQIRHVNYSPPFQAAIPSITKSRDVIGTKRIAKDQFVELKEALQRFTHIIESPESVFELKLNPGECVIFDNRRIVHARRQFNTSEGSRWLAGAYVDTDAMLSRFNVCNKQNPTVWNRSSPVTWLRPPDDTMDVAGTPTQAIQAAYLMGDEMKRDAKEAKEVVGE